LQQGANRHQPTLLSPKRHRSKTNQQVARAKVLAVGAGGIGCELLKTLVLSGFRDIHTVRRLRKNRYWRRALARLARRRRRPSLAQTPPTTSNNNKQHQIDLDTIETSNLNRQFLFRRSHVSQPKAEVAAAAVRAFAPRVDADATTTTTTTPSVRGERANIKEPRFDVDFFRSFDVVLNGLDNAEARRHVNRLCLAAGVPLVESGTAGYLGQVTVHVRGLSQCYECTPKPPATKTYPVCTLRNTPDKPIHCVVWAKDLLFAQLFGGPGAVTDLDDRGAAADAGGAAAGANGGASGKEEEGEGKKDGQEKEEAEKAAAAKKAAEEEAAERKSAFARREGEAALAYAARVFEHEYGSVVRRLAANTSLWAPKDGAGGKGNPAAVGRAKPPEPLSLAALLSLPASSPSPDAAPTAAALSPEALAALAATLGLPDPSTTTTAPTTPKTRSAARAVGLSDDHRVWSEAESAKVWLRAAVALLEERPGGLTEAFDKDDDLAVDFVVASANLRGSCFSIEPQTRFAAKGMAGNIVHAIATTNAAVAGLVVVEATKLLAGLAPQACHSTFLNEADRRTGRARAPYRVLLARAALEAPNKECMACGRAVVTLRADTQKLTLERLVARVLKGSLALNEPTLVSDNGFMYEEGEGLEEDEREANAAMLPKVLAELPGGGVKGGAVLSVSDQSQGGVRVELVVRHDASLDELEAPEGFVLEGWAGPAAKKEEGGEKRAREEGEAAAAAEGGGGDAKRARAAAADDAMDAAVAADDDDGGPVQILSSDGAGGAAAGGGDGGGEIVLSSD
jgi:ubiquitin-like 1-activating enzyme E1 B